MHNDLNLEFRAHGAFSVVNKKRRNEKSRGEKMCNFNAVVFDNDEREPTIRSTSLAKHENRTLSVFCVLILLGLRFRLKFRGHFCLQLTFFVKRSDVV